MLRRELVVLLIGIWNIKKYYEMKNYNICVVGAGKWGKNHVKVLYELNSLGGVVDKDKIAVNKLKKKYPDCLFFSNLASTFKHNFDAYIVATPPSSHYVIAKEIIKNSKHVLVEKPLTLNLIEAEELNELSKEFNINLMVGHLLLFHPAFKKIQEIIQNGKLGELQYIYSNRLNLGNFRQDENVLWSFAPHDIALFNYFFKDTPHEVTSRGLDILQKGIHDTTITSLNYTNKRMGHIFVSWLHPFKEHRFVIVGSEGMIHFEDAEKNKPLFFTIKMLNLVRSQQNLTWKNPRKLNIVIKWP